jgi:hypothetical protein
MLVQALVAKPPWMIVLEPASMLGKRQDAVAGHWSARTAAVTSD